MQATEYIEGYKCEIIAESLIGGEGVVSGFFMYPKLHVSIFNKKRGIPYPMDKIFLLELLNI